MMPTTTYTWKVVRVVPEAPKVVSLYLEIQHGKRPMVIAGQYLTVLLPDMQPIEGKAYSISSAPDEPFIRLTIKQMGRFSSSLMLCGAGDTIHTSAPYGFFYPEPHGEPDLVFIAGGIGITPCIAIITALAAQDDTRALHLCYSNKTEADIVFRDELGVLLATHTPLSVTHFITREKPITPGFRAGRMTVARIADSVPRYREKEYFLCGSIDFTRSLWKGLRDAYVPQHQLYTEAFF